MTTLFHEKKIQVTYKPGSVQGKTPWMTIHLGWLLPITSSNLPEQKCANPLSVLLTTVKTTALCSYLVLLRVGFALPRLLPSARCALTAPFHPYLTKKTLSGGIVSVALSLKTAFVPPPPDVIRHPVCLEPGLSSRIKNSSDHPVTWI